MYCSDILSITTPNIGFDVPSTSVFPECIKGQPGPTDCDGQQLLEICAMNAFAIAALSGVVVQSRPILRKFLKIVQ